MTIIEILQIIGGVSGGLLMILLSLAVFTGLDLDMDMDAPDVDTGGVGWVKGLLAFLAAGSGAMLLGLRAALPTWQTVVLGVVVGALMTYLLGAFLRFLLRQQENTNWELHEAISRSGKVYLRIPPDGEGLVHVDVKGVMREFKARSADKQLLPTGTEVLVVDIEEEYAIVVSA
jgi:membrane protein implicated in regulation of membrane protease activity